MRELKICIIGAGSTYSPELIDGCLNRTNKIKVKEFALMDINQERLNIVGGLIERMCQNFATPPIVTKTVDMIKAIKDADYVITQFRVGMLPARAKDERISLKHGYIGQETTGPGGFAKAMRTIPVILEVAKVMKEHAPNARLINFTNPSGIITEAVSRFSDVPVVGLCNSPITILMSMKKYLNLGEQDLYMDYFGLNHLGFIKGLYLDGKDVTKKLFEQILDSPDCDKILGYKFNKRQAMAMGILPMGYLQYYYHQQELYDKISSQEKTRGELLVSVDEELLREYSNPELKTKPAGLEQRGGAWYSEAAIALIESFETNDKKIHIVCVPNNGCIKGIDDKAVIEIPAVVSGDILKPLHFGELPEAMAGIFQHVKNYETLAVKAGGTNSADKALLALIAHPFIRSVNDAEKILDEIIEQHAEYIKLK